MGIQYCQTCQLTAITYPEKIDGKTAILFAAPSGTGRDSGKFRRIEYRMMESLTGNIITALMGQRIMRILV